MTDFERWLRAVMAASAEPAPAGLLDGVRSRHRRHRRRVGAACLAAVAAAAIAVPLATRGIPSGSASGTAASGAGAGSTPAGAAGAVLRDCQSNNNGTLGPDWKAGSVHAGPVWFIYLRPKNTAGPGQRLVTGKLTASGMVIAISNGRTAEVTAAPVTRGRYRFLARFNDEGRPYTLAEGAPGLILAGCPAGIDIPASYAPGLTLFWEGYVTDLRGCIPLEVRTSPAGQPISVVLPAPGGGCGS
jgi:hypothetical protein